MCHNRHVWVVYGCGHRYVAPGTPAGEGELIDCGIDRCRVSTAHPEWCTGQTCKDRGCWTYRMHPQNFVTKHYTEACPWVEH